MRFVAVLAVGILARLSAGCGRLEADPRPEWLVTIATDAPVPQFGDRLLVEVIDREGHACSGCRREFGITSETTWPVSVGVVASGPDNEPLQNRRVRVRLYRSSTAGTDGPVSNRHLDGLVALEPTDRLVTVALRLSMRCFGMLSDLAADTTCDPATGTSSATPTAPAISDDDVANLPKPGSWPDAASTPCATAPEKGMVCIPGGLFLLGSSTFVPIGPQTPVPEQLVKLPPFFLDANEFSVSDMRKAVAKGVARPAIEAGCSYTTSPSTNEELPVNCVTWKTAAAACAALGKRLPTEAEWEWAAGNEVDETDLPWGPLVDVDDLCANANLGRSSKQGVGSFRCATKDEDRSLAKTLGGNPGDVTRSGVHNMAGNVNEWMADAFLSYEDPACWGDSVTMRVAPRCEAEGSYHSVRGASYDGYPYGARVSVRNASLEPGNRGLGFRCAK